VFEGAGLTVPDSELFATYNAPTNALHCRDTKVVDFGINHDCGAVIANRCAARRPAGQACLNKTKWEGSGWLAEKAVCKGPFQANFIPYLDQL